jgi:hypothetical protein
MQTKIATIPPDDLRRHLTLVQPEFLPHIGLVGDTYTITVTGEQTDGHFCVIDMHIPPGGGRGRRSTVHAGETLHIPANAPHQFHNGSAAPVRMLCICSGGARKVLPGDWLSCRHPNTPPPKLDEKEEAAFIEKVNALAPKYRTELLLNA